MLRLGIVGWGAIGAGVGRRMLEGATPEARLVAVLRRSGAAIAEDRSGLSVHRDLDGFLASPIDVALEAGGATCMRACAAPILEKGISLIVMSVAALADDGYRAELIAAARRGGAKILAPAGALAGLDAVSAGALGRIDRVTATQRKPPAALLPAEEAAALTAERELARGSARDAGARFPKNANIAVGLGLAAGDLDGAQVRIVADPAVSRNCVDYQVEGAFGRLMVSLESEPSENKRTSQMAVFSALATIRRLSEPLVIGA